jgi:hypothetical protein
MQPWRPGRGAAVERARGCAVGCAETSPLGPEPSGRSRGGGRLRRRTRPISTSDLAALPIPGEPCPGLGHRKQPLRYPRLLMIGSSGVAFLARFLERRVDVRGSSPLGRRPVGPGRRGQGGRPVQLAAARTRQPLTRGSARGARGGHTICRAALMARGFCGRRRASPRCHPWVSSQYLVRREPALL